ncbi:hypothetical protein GYMLUDRAFT_118735, partial [Collybiopsis luxurians FD-317 M1]
HILGLFQAKHVEFHGNIINYDRAVRIFVGSQHDILLHKTKKISEFREAALNAGG